jgi:hypothetical protein
MSLVDSKEALILDAVFGDAAYTDFAIQDGVSGDAYIGLATGDPGETSGAVNEISGNNYSRVTYTLSTDWDAASGGVTQNAAVFTFPAASGGDWGSVSYFLLDDDSLDEGFAHEAYGALGAPLDIYDGDVAKFGIGDVSFTMSDLFTEYAMDLILDFLLLDIQWSPGLDFYAALSTTTPASDGTNFTEPSGGAYARVTITRSTTWNSAFTGDPTTIDNLVDITWTSATASWGTITYWGIYDASSGGNLIAYGALDSSQAVGNGDQIKFAAGDLILTLD